MAVTARIVFSSSFSSLVEPVDDAAESSLCGYMAWIALAGLLLNAVWGKSWADPVAALTVVPLIVREGFKLCALRGLGASALRQY